MPQSASMDNSKQWIRKAHPDNRLLFKRGNNVQFKLYESALSNCIVKHESFSFHFIFNVLFTVAPSTKGGCFSGGRGKNLITMLLKKFLQGQIRINEKLKAISWCTIPRSTEYTKI